MSYCRVDSGLQCRLVHNGPPNVQTREKVTTTDEDVIKLSAVIFLDNHHLENTEQFLMPSCYHKCLDRIT